MKVRIRYEERAGAVGLDLCFPCSTFVSCLLDAGPTAVITSEPLLTIPATVQEIVERVEQVHQKQREHAEIQCIHEMTATTCPICMNGGRLGPRAQCAGCGESIVWVVTVNRRPMPVDAEPVAHGNVIYGDSLDGKVVVRVLTKDEPYRGPRYLAHQATCRHPPKRPQRG